MWRLARYAQAFVLGLAAIAWAAGARAGPAEDLGQQFLLSSNWTYQLQGARPADLDKTLYDVVVMDAFFGGGAPEVEKLRQMPQGRRRINLAYLSIGEAEVYRYYWQRCCTGGKRPAWIGPENKRWPGNFRVEYWDPEWKSIIYDDEQSYLKRIIDLGFDGVYLDRIDVHAEFKGAKADARARMVAFVRALSAKAKALKPGFLVVAQNAEELATDDSYLAAIDGIAKEDLLFGETADGKRNPPDNIAFSTEMLKRAQSAGKHIMVVEYLKEASVIEKARTEILELGFAPYFAPRGLQHLQVENLEMDDTH